MSSQQTNGLNPEQRTKLRVYLTDEVNKVLATEQGRAKQRNQAIEEALGQAYARTKVMLSDSARLQLFEEVVANLGGLGRLQPLDRR